MDFNDVCSILGVETQELRRWIYYAGMYADIIHTKQRYETNMHQEDSPRLMIIGESILEQNTFAKY
jgi:hypothetical protein